MKYIAYGSNMDIAQMNHRCPGAKIVGKGVVEGWRLLFKGRLYSAVATIEKSRKTSKVPVLVWEINKMHEDALDIYEGFPRLYTKDTIEVKMEDGTTVEGMVYLIDPNLSLGAPSSYYYGVIRDAYKMFNFDLGILKRAVLSSTQYWRKRG